MKKNILIRHAKSAWDNPWLEDHDRPLAQRGLDAAPKMGRKLQKLDVYPDLILSSTALRAKQTAELIAKEIGYPIQDIQFEEGLYHSSASTIMHYIHEQKNDYTTLYIVCHNPGITDLVNKLGYVLDNLPTAGIVCFKSDCKEWNEFLPDNIVFDFYDYPKKGN